MKTERCCIVARMNSCKYANRETKKIFRPIILANACCNKIL